MGTMSILPVTAARLLVARLIWRSDRQFEIEFLDSGVEAFAFTFG